MGSFITQQPNGLYCRFSSVTDCPTHWNMTREDYINYYLEKARHEAIEILDHPYPFTNVIDEFVPNNMTRKEFNRFLRETKQPVNLKEE